MTKTIQLQSIGKVPAVPASELKSGDVRMYNFGSTGLIIKVIDKTPKTLMLIMFENGQYWVSDIRKDTLVCIAKRDQDVSEHKPSQAYKVGRNKGMMDVSEYFTQEEPESIETAADEGTEEVQTNGKIKVKEIVFLWSESPVIKNNQTVSTFAEAESIIKDIALDIRKNEGFCRKTGFMIRWEDDNEYQGRIDVTASHGHKNQPLKAHIEYYCLSSAGKLRPDNYTQEQYETLLKAMGNDEEQQKAYIKFLDTYALEDITETEPTNNNKVREAVSADPAHNSEQENEPETGTCNASYTLNDEHNGIEINFTDKPDQSVIDELKENGFRWHKFKKVWYAKQSAERLELVKALCSVNSEDTGEPEQQTEEAAQETTNEPETAHNAQGDVIDIIIEHSANLLYDWETDTKRTYNTAEEKAEYKTKLKKSIDEIEITEDIITAVREHVGNGLLVEALESFIDPYAFNVDTSYKFHDIHFKTWNMEQEAIETVLTAHGIPFDVAYDKFICKGLILEQVFIIEDMNRANAAILFYDGKYNEKQYNSVETNEPEAVKTPYEYGIVAFHNGKVCAPAMDEEFLQVYIKGLKVGEGKELIQEWLNGWHSANLAEPVNANNNEAKDEPTYDNVVQFPRKQEEENTNNSMINNEPEVNVNDDFLSMFDQVEIENNSRIAADDMEYCQAEQTKYNTAIQMIMRLAEEIKNTSGLDILSKEWHRQKSSNEYLDAYKFRDMRTLADDIKSKFIGNIVHYIEKKYNVTIESEKLKNASDYNVTYENILDYIFLQLDGFSFEEKATKEIKDKLRGNFDNRWSKVNIKNMKLTITDYVWWDSYSWNGKRIGYNDSKVNPLLHALSLFERGSTDMLGTFENILRELKEGEQKFDIFSKYEFDHLDKVKSFKVFKNGKTEIEFASTELAKQFAREYCGYTKAA